MLFVLIGTSSTIFGTPAIAEGALGAGAGDNLFAGELLVPNELVDLAVRRNPDLAAAEAAAREAATRIRVAGSLDDPMITYSIAPATISSSIGARQGIEISQALPWPGTLGARKAKARAEASATSEDAVGRRLELISTAKSAFAEWAFIHAALVVNDHHRAELQILASAAERSYAAAASSQEDAVQSRIEWLRTENAYLKLESERRGVQARINALLNRSADSPLPRPSVFGALPPIPSIDQLTRLMLAHHPGLRRAEAMRDASSSGVKLARKGFYPDLSVSAGYDEMWNDTEMRLMVGISLSIPLQWGRHEAELSGARAAHRQAELSVESKKAGLLAALTEAHATAEQTARSVALYRDSVLPLAETAAAAALSSYRQGTVSFKSAIEADRSKFDERLNYERALADQYRAFAQLERAAGGSISGEAFTDLETQQ